MNTPSHQIHDMEQLLRELAARELRSVKMNDAMTARLEARLEARFRRLAEHGYNRSRLLACAAALMLALGCLALLELPQPESAAVPAHACLPPAEVQTIAAAEWDKHFPPAPEREAVTRNGIEFHIETEEELPFTINDCFL
ncbi:MAG: hypothetical protein IJ498_03115 [Akkermansia sp.]|nr:hypothetical protein [Akkermansia sp.]